MLYRVRSSSILSSCCHTRRISMTMPANSLAQIAAPMSGCPPYSQCYPVAAASGGG